MKKTWLFIAAILATSLQGYMLATFVFPALDSFLSKNEKTAGNIVIIEGWLSFNDLRAAANEIQLSNYDHIITTGLYSRPKFYGMHMDGSLIFYLPDSIGDITEIGVTAKSGKKLSADFNLNINGLKSDTFTASQRQKRFSLKWDGSSVDSVIVEFYPGDSSILLVKDVVLNNEFHIPFINNSEYDTGELDNRERIINDFRSNSELSAKRLALFVSDSLSIIPVPGDKVRINRTLTSAVAVKEWLDSNNINAKGINIISSGTHSRRTWMTFSHVLGNKIPVGIVSLPGTNQEKDDKTGYLKILRETLAFLYYCLVLSAY